MNKFTVKQFRALYPTEESCLDKIFVWRYGSLEACPACQCKADFRRIPTRRCYQCKSCYTQFYPTAGTPFEKTRISLQDWFYIIHLFVTTRNGVAAKEIERQIGCTYKTAWRMGHQIRALFGGKTIDQLQGTVEIDEMFLGERVKGIQPKNPNQKPKQPIFGAIERGGKVVMRMIPKANKATLEPLVFSLVETRSLVLSDESTSYKGLARWYERDTVNHGYGQYAKANGTHVNTIEGQWSHLRRMLYGTHIHVSPKYLQNYLDEYTFRTNHRGEGGAMFETILKRIPVVSN